MTARSLNCSFMSKFGPMWVETPWNLPKSWIRLCSLAYKIVNLFVFGKKLCKRSKKWPPALEATDLQPFKWITYRTPNNYLQFSKQPTSSHSNYFPLALQTTDLQPSKSAQLFKVSSALLESSGRKRKVK